MNVVILGAGNVGAVMGRLCQRSDHTVVQVYNRTLSHAVTLANELGTEATDNMSAVKQTADVYIIAVADNALAGIASSLRIPSDALVVHTTGAASMNILQHCNNHYGVLYPLQSIRKEKENIPVIPFFIDANNELAKSKLYDFACTLSSMVSYAGDEQRMKLHVVAVIASDFTNHLYTQAALFCEKEKLPFSFLTPIIEETALRLRHNPPAQMQTGPAIRKDNVTIDKHIALLEKYPDLQELYCYLTERIQKSR